MNVKIFAIRDLDNNDIYKSILQTKDLELTKKYKKI